MKINVKAFALACGIVLGITILVLTYWFLLFNYPSEELAKLLTLILILFLSACRQAATPKWPRIASNPASYISLPTIFFRSNNFKNIDQKPYKV